MKHKVIYVDFSHKEVKQFFTIRLLKKLMASLKNMFTTVVPSHTKNKPRFHRNTKHIL